LKASFSFSCGTTVPDETWEALARTSEIAFFGTSSILPTVFPGFWESRGKTWFTKLKKKEVLYQYKAL